MPTENTPPPFDNEAEGAVLSAVMLDCLAIPKLDFLKPEHFYSEAHRRIYEAALELHAEGKAHDIVQVCTRLRDRKRIEQVGGVPYVTEILNAAPGVTNVRAYATTVYEKARIREAIATAQRIEATGYVGDTSNAQKYLDEAARAFGTIARRSIGAGGETNLDALKRIVAELRARSEGASAAMRGISYGFPSLDEMTGGMHSGELIYVVALTGVGKTAFSINVALNALAAGIGVQVFSTETSRQEWLEAAVSCRGHIDNAVWSKRAATGPEWDRVQTAMKEIAGWKHLSIDATEAPDVDYITSVCRARSETSVKLDGKPLGLVIVDNLHCLAPSADMAREPRKDLVIKRSSEKLKALAARIGVPVLTLAQQRDNPFDKSTKLRQRPQSGSIADCRSAERDAGKVYYLHRAPMERGGKEFGEDPTRVLVIPTKARGAAVKDVELKLIGAHGRLVDIAGETQDRYDPLMPTRDYIDAD